MSAFIEAMARRLQQAERQANAKLAVKWQREIAMLDHPSHIKAMADLGVSIAVLDEMAIYATQKLRRLVQSYLGAGRADPYTEIVVRNAMTRTGYALTAQQIVGALDADAPLEPGDSLAYRRISAPGTAQTQASSTKAALAAVGAADLRRQGHGVGLVIDPTHPVITAIVAGLG